MELTKPNVLSIKFNEVEKASLEMADKLVLSLKDALIDNNMNCIEVDEWSKYTDRLDSLEYIDKEELEWLHKYLHRLLVEDITMKVKMWENG